MTASKEGYLYIFSNPSLPGWFKVGRTQRPPFRRAEELSGTSIPTSFEVEYALFFENCFSAETAAHKLIMKTYPGVERKKEFFKLALNDIQDILLNLNITPPKTLKNRKITENASEEIDLEQDGIELWYEHAIDEWETQSKWGQAQAFYKMEKLSKLGLGKASWALGEWILHMNPTHWGYKQASFVFDAAEKQGIHGGRFRAAWLRSLTNPEAIHEWLDQLSKLWDSSGASLQTVYPTFWKTIENELQIWKFSPERSRYPIWNTILSETMAENPVQGSRGAIALELLNDAKQSALSPKC